jgi:putative ABC transport system ATP-binding protein
MISAIAVSKSFGDDGVRVDAVRRVTLHIARGEFVSLMGPSGCGKSTLLHMLGGIERPTAGRIIIDAMSLFTVKDRDRTLFRRRRIGFVFQNFNLIPSLTVEENIRFPLLIDGRTTPRLAGDRLERLLCLTGLEDQRERFPWQLSGGQMQRVAVARAFIADPAVILLDEPTGSLDSKNGRDVMRLVVHAQRDFKATVVLVTHDPFIAGFADKILFMRDGRIVHELKRREEAGYPLETVIALASGGEQNPADGPSAGGSGE